jgi:hypothetical protein
MIPLFLATREAGMRGVDERTGSLFSYVDLEDRVPAKHPLRVIRRVVNDVLAALDGEFAKLYADGTTVDCAGAATARIAVTGVLYRPLGDAADRAA